MIAPAFAVAATASIAMISSPGPIGLGVFGTGKLVNSPLLDSGTTVPMLGSERAAARRRVAKPRGTTVSAFSRMTSPAVTMVSARLTEADKAQMRSLVMSRTPSCCARLLTCFVILASGLASFTRMAAVRACDCNSGNRLSRHALVAS